MIAAHAAQRLARMGPLNPSGLLTCDQISGLVYASDMVIHYGARQPISDANPTGSRVPSTGLVLSWDGHTTRNGKAKNFADPSGNTDGVASGGVAIGGASGVRGAGTAFDGVDDLMTFPDAGRVQGTMRVLFYRDQLVLGERPYYHGANGPGTFMNSDGTIACLFGGATGMPLTSGQGTNPYACPVGLHELVFAWSTTTYWFWLDGKLVETQAGCTFPVTAGNLLLANNNGSTYSKLKIYEIEGWNRPISNAEVRQLYEDTYGWVENKANPHCKDITTQYPLGSDRDVLLGGANTPITDANPTGSRVSKDGLVLSFDGSSLTNHAGGADGVASGGVALGGVMGPRGPATAFDGVDDWISISAGGVTSSTRTMRLVAYRTRTDVSEKAMLMDSTYISFGSNGNLSVKCPPATGMPVSGNWTGGAAGVGVGWHEVIFVHDATSYALYLDGEMVESNSGCTFPVQGMAVALGGVTGYFLTGQIAEAQVWSRKLSNKEIRQLHEDFWGHWSSRDSNPHCLDISDEHPLGTDRVSADGLVASYDMETLTAQGYLKDFSGQGNDAVPVGSPKYQAGRVKNGAYLFASSQYFQSVNDLANSDGLTLFAWVKTTAIGTTQTILRTIGTAYGTALRIETNGAIKTWASGATNGRTTSAGDVVANVPTFIAVTFKSNDPAGSKVYKNGVQLGTAGATGPMSLTPGPIYVGGIATSETFIGTIGQCGVLARALSDEEIANLYQDSQKASGLGQGCVLALDMETLTADGKLKDFSGAGNHATITGAKYQRGAIKNGAYDFSGTANHLQVARSSSIIDHSANKITMYAWVQADAITGFRSIFRLSTSTLGYILRTSDGTIQSYLKFSGGAVNRSAGVIAAGTTYFIAVTFDGTLRKHYINGVEVGSWNDSASGTLDFSASVGDLYLGKSPLGDELWDGRLGQMGIIMGALTPTQIQQMFIDGQKMLGLCQGNPGNVPGQVGSACDLNGTSQYVEVQDCPALNPSQLTVGAWVNSDSPQSAYSRVIDKLASNLGYRLLLSDSNKAVSFDVGTGSGVSSGVSPGNLWTYSKWILVAGTSDTLIAVDGVAYTKAAAPPSASPSVLRLGYGPSTSYYLNGRIAFPFIFNRALSASEIAYIYRVGRMSKW